MQCPKCGTECAQKAAFCDWCGEKLHAADKTTFSQYEVKEYSFLQALEDYWNNAFNFSGRARRKEFWYACLWNVLFLLLISAIGRTISVSLHDALETAFYLAVFVPNISLALRRVHDIGKSGYYLFIGLIPFVGHIALAVMFSFDGDHDENKYGASTKYIKGN